MHKTVFRWIAVLMIVSFLVSPLAGTTGNVSAQDGAPPDVTILDNSSPPIILRVDDNPAMQNIHTSGPTAADALASPAAALSTFTITYLSSGNDYWGHPCSAFPDLAKTAFNAAAAIWAARIKSAIPIKIDACWATGLTGLSVVRQGYNTSSTAFPKTNTWYPAALADALGGFDYAAGTPELYVSLNNSILWYTGLDGVTPPGQYDLVTAVTGTIAHGIGFTGSASYFGGGGSYGDSGFPYIYDTFMEDSTGKKLTAYTTPSNPLGTLLTSNSLWFNGPNANAANGYVLTKIYAPYPWVDNSSYIHLDYSTFAGTPNSMMVSALASGSSQQTPGPVVMGILQDLGWQVGTLTFPPITKAPGGYISTTKPTFSWSRVSGATSYALQVYKGTTKVYGLIVPASACSSTTCSSTPATILTYAGYQWRVKAQVGGVYGTYSAFLPFTVMPLGFTSTFTTNSTGWTPLSGTWTRTTGYYSSVGIANKWATAKHSNNYPVFTYTVRFKRTGCLNCANAFYFYGSPTPLGPTNSWYSGYVVAIANNGTVMVGRYDTGVYSFLVGWAVNTAVVPDDWNTVKITMKDTFAQIFINDTRVLHGTLSTFSNGQVGIGMYNDASAGNKLTIDYATLSTSAPGAYLVTGQGDPSDKYFNEATGEGIDPNVSGNPFMAP